MSHGNLRGEDICRKHRPYGLTGLGAYLSNMYQTQALRPHRPYSLSVLHRPYGLSVRYHSRTGPHLDSAQPGIGPELSSNPAAAPCREWQQQGHPRVNPISMRSFVKPTRCSHRGRADGALWHPPSPPAPPHGASREEKGCPGGLSTRSSADYQVAV
jgi:hypothetical protein